MGIVKVKKAAEATVTSVNKGPGTFPYMAPEMFKSSRRGPAVDIYSLGCLFIELFVRKRVWPDLDATAIMMKVVGSYDTPPVMPDTLPPLSSIWWVMFKAVPDRCKQAPKHTGSSANG